MYIIGVSAAMLSTERNATGDIIIMVSTKLELEDSYLVIEKLPTVMIPLR